MKPIDFEVQKTTEQFLNNYKKHDLARVVLKTVLEKRGIKLVPYGEDKRHERIWAEGEDKPNAWLEQNGQRVAFVDWKGHEKDDYMLNERAYYSYINHAKSWNIPMYCVWLIIPTKKLLFAKMPFARPSRQFMEHDKNWVIAASEAEVKSIDQLISELQPLEPEQQSKPNNPCPICHSTDWWWRPASQWGPEERLCGRCHPNPNKEPA